MPQRGSQVQPGGFLTGDTLWETIPHTMSRRRLSRRVMHRHVVDPARKRGLGGVKSLEWRVRPRGRPSQNTNMPKNPTARPMVHQVAEIRSICQATSRRTTPLRTAFLMSSPGHRRGRALSHSHTQSWRARGRRSPTSVVAASEAGNGHTRSFPISGRLDYVLADGCDMPSWG